jgi:Taurine catabolism dioxygenase TauD, TfdA family
MPEISEFPEGVASLIIPEQRTFDGQPFPLVLTPSPSHLDRDNAYWQQWIRDNQDRLKLLLQQYGAILFRQFPLHEPADFDQFAKSFGWTEFQYLGGVAVRNAVVGNVVTSTEAPPDRLITYHHEMAHVNDYPKVRLSIYQKRT